ncbi:class I SAM-dependent methyltransferase [Limnofasciculus baicalensis]|uniref:Class I SAM-dependent methyltransferase n=1 Tax=Limnofasciculus baicalensis BBK-W-15 TaxID=2699891 RepID=A0AAE3GLS5_9CYAN|nr:class I SAM-dependent methyltransferase [Limnofasciculus baicalensis]MCP2726905.1 class I SAM-dependent methyltransferase [Limnofasciculus baicalensis BBK-W-15]
MPNLSKDQEISKLAWQVYCDAPMSIRLLASARTYICPMLPLLVEVPDNSTIFDIGCGSGLFLSLLVANSQVRSGIGTDLNIKALNSAKLATKRLTEKQPEVMVDFQQTGDCKEWPNTSFSVVSMIDVMHHIPPQAQYTVFAAAIERIAPGGRLIYKDMCLKPWWKATANRLHDLLLAREWINYVPIETIKEWGSQSGLKLVNESYYSRYVYGHEKLVFVKN